MSNKHYLGAYHTVQALDTYLKGNKLPLFALVARSNAGKSSLINSLIGSNSAHVSQTPGKTKAAQLFQGQGYLLIDLPGYGWTRAGDRQDMDRILLECLEMKRPLRVLRLVDANRALGFPKFVEKDAKLLGFLHKQGLRYETIITKTDAVRSAELHRLRLLLPREAYPWYCSSRTRQGIAELHKHLQS